MLNLETMQFDPGPTMESSRYGCAACSLDADRVLVVGGCYDGDFLASTEILGAAKKQRRPR